MEKNLPKMIEPWTKKKSHLSASFSSWFNTLIPSYYYAHNFFHVDMHIALFHIDLHTYIALSQRHAKAFLSSPRLMTFYFVPCNGVMCGYSENVQWIHGRSTCIRCETKWHMCWRENVTGWRMRSVLGSFTRSGDAVVFGVFGVVQWCSTCSGDGCIRGFRQMYLVADVFDAFGRRVRILYTRGFMRVVGQSLSLPQFESFMQHFRGVRL